MFFRAAVFLLALIAATHAAGAESPAAPSTVTRAETMATAEKYRTLEWIPAAANVRHGRDAKDIRVDTPDENFRGKSSLRGWWTAGLLNVSMPYKWGGFDTPETFLAGIVEGKAAGDVSSAEKRRLDDAAVSADAVGIDCSGFVSRCWNLPRAFSTRTLTTLCEPVRNFRDLQPGDILNAPNSHVFLFQKWTMPDRSRMLVYTTGTPPIWAVQTGPLRTKQMAPVGYTAWRYRGMRD